MAAVEEWEWTDDKQRCLDLVLAGTAKTRIAAELGVHRNTINNWCAHPVFAARLREELQDHTDRVGRRRIKEASIFADVAGKVAIEAARTLDKNPEDAHARKTFREFTQEWRDSVVAEREVLGVNVKRVEARVESQVTHQLGQSFKETLLERVRAGKVIDVEAIESAGDPMAAVQGVVRGLLAGDPDVLDKIHASEAATEQSDNKRRR